VPRSSTSRLGRLCEASSRCFTLVTDVAQPVYPVSITAESKPITVVVYLAFLLLLCPKRFHIPRQATPVNAIKVIGHTRVEIRLWFAFIYRFRRRCSYLRGFNRRDNRVLGYRVAQLRLEINALARGQYSSTRRCWWSLALRILVDNDRLRWLRSFDSYRL
jgi:hypothetical protein